MNHILEAHYENGYTQALVDVLLFLEKAQLPLNSKQCFKQAAKKIIEILNQEKETK